MKFEKLKFKTRGIVNTYNKHFKVTINIQWCIEGIGDAKIFFISYSKRILFFKSLMVVSNRLLLYT